MNVIALIPARGGSKRVPRKNMQMVGGIPLVERAIRVAKESHLIKTIVVSTEDPEIAAHCEGLCEVHKRDGYDARDDSTMGDVILDWSPHYGWEGLLVILQPTSPLRTAQDIDRAILATIEEGASRSCTVDPTGKRNGAVYILRDGDAQHPIWADTWLAIEMPAERSLDINDMSDLEEARRILGP